jgi:hypothetical protein
MSDATGIATWYDPLPSLSGSFWALGGNPVSSIQNIGTTTNFSLPFITNNIERMRLTANGNVGIGTVAPSSRLQVVSEDNSSTTNIVNFVALNLTQGVGINYGGIYKTGTNPNSNLDIAAKWNGNILLGTVSTGVGSTGNVGIGTANPGARLTINTGDNNVAGGISFITGAGTDWRMYASDNGAVGGGAGFHISGSSAGSEFWIGGWTGISNTFQSPSANPGSTPFMTRGVTGQTADLFQIRSDRAATNGNVMTVTNNGNVGIGTSTPGAKLDIVGNDARINGLTVGRWGGNSQNTTVGAGAFPNNTAGYYNTAIWQWAGYYNTTGIANTTLWYNAGYNITTWSNNIAIWYITMVPSNTASNQLNIGNWIYGDNGNIGIGVTSASAKLEIAGQIKITGGSPGSGKILVSDATGLASWQSSVPASSVNATNITGWVPDYITKFGSGWVGVYQSLLYETGTRIGLGNTNPGYTLDVTGTGNFLGFRLPTGAGAGKVLTSDASGGATWSSALSGATATGITGGAQNYVPKFGTGGTWLYSSQIFDNGTAIGIGTTTPIARLTLSGSALITGDITIQGRVITDTIVNRTVANVSISGSLLPDALAPMIYRDIWSSTQQWNNLYLAWQATLAGGSPWLGKILTSDATGLASWASWFSGSTTAAGITGGTEGYITKFGTGGNGILSSLFYETGSYVALGSITPMSRFEIWSGATIMFHTRGTNNLGIGSSAVRYQTTGTSNVGIGPNTLRTLTTWYSNAGVGEGALYGNTTGYFNTAIGAQALYSNSIGNWNVAMGNQALWTNLSWNYSVAIGWQALYSNSTNSNNIAIGYQALRATIADSNIAIGYSAGSGITSGTNNIIIWTNAQAQSNTASNQLNIGNWIYGSGGDISIGRSTVWSGNYQVDIAGGFVNSASGYCINNSCIPNWSWIFDAINGQGNYLPKWNASGTWLLASRLSDNGTDISISSGALQQILITPANQDQYQQVIISTGWVLKKGLTTREKLRIFAVSDYGANNDSVAIQNLCFDNSTSTACKPAWDPSILTNVPNFNSIDPKSYTWGIGEYYPATTTRPPMFVSYYTGTYMVVNSYTFNSTSFTTSDLGCNVFPYFSLYSGSGAVPNLEIYDSIAPVTFTIDSSTAISNVFSSTNLSLPTQKTTRVGSQFVSNVFMTPGQTLVMSMWVQSCASRLDRSMSLVTNDQRKMTLSITEL